MIIDTIENIGAYTCYSKYINKIQFFLENMITKTFSQDLYALGDGACAMVNDYSPSETGAYEAHREFIDVQYIVRGSEKMVWSPLSLLSKSSGYAPDIELFADTLQDGVSFVLREGQFVLFDTFDAHAPGLKADSDSILKLVFKLPVK